MVNYSSLLNSFLVLPKRLILFFANLNYTILMKKNVLTYLLLGASTLTFATTNATLPLTLIETSEKVDQTWKYTITEQTPDWNFLEFDDTDWLQGPGGFGKLSEFQYASTEWITPGWIYLRKKFTTKDLNAASIAALKLRLFNDDWVEVYINGALAYKTVSGWESNYVTKSLDQDALDNFNPNGENVLAVKCFQNTGGQYIDCGLYTTIEGATSVALANQSTVAVFVTGTILNVTGDAISEINIYDIYGKLFQSEKTNSSLNFIDISMLSSGVYVAAVATEGKQIIAKFIK